VGIAARFDKIAAAGNVWLHGGAFAVGRLDDGGTGLIGPAVHVALGQGTKGRKIAEQQTRGPRLTAR